MNLEQLKTREPIEKLKVLWQLPRIIPEYKKHIVYRHGYWDGILSGALRWNGGFFLFTCVMDEEDFLPCPLEDSDGNGDIDMTRDGTRYYAVYAISREATRQVIKKHIAFKRAVGGNNDYRRPSGLHPQSKWTEYYDRKWPIISQESTEIIAWFRK